MKEVKKIKGLVSVIIPTYNREKSIFRAIESVLEQNYTNIEVLVCDDFSSDRTYEVVKSIMKIHGNVKWLQRIDKGKGANWARNNGIENAKGEYIAFLDSDDEFIKDSISNRIKIFKEHPEIDMVYGDVDVNNIIHRYDMIQKYDQNKYLMEELSLCCFITIMVKSQVFETVPLLNNNLKSWQDDELVLNLNKYGKQMYHCGKSVANIRRVDESISTNQRNLYYGCKKIVEIYKNDIIKTKSIVWFYIWKLRIARNFISARMEESNNIIMKVYYKILHKIINSICHMLFRHIYG